MIKESIGVATTVDDARKMAVENLHAPEDADVKVEILTFPKKKVLGLFGGSDAKVRAYYEAADAPKKDTPKGERKSAPKKTLLQRRLRRKKHNPKKMIKKMHPRRNRLKKKLLPRWIFPQ